MSNEIPTLTKRRLQASVIKPIYEEMVLELGEDAARIIIDRAVRRAAIAEAGEFAAKAPGGKTSMRSFIDLYEHWTADGALEVEVHIESDDQFDFDVTRCRYAEMYHELGVAHIGHLLSCNRDGTFCEGYDPNITLTRERTIMSGARRCTFRYRYDGDKNEP